MLDAHESNPGAVTPVRSRPNGHLVVVRGFDPSDNVMVNDPAGRHDNSVRYTYDRAQLDAAGLTPSEPSIRIHPLDRPLLASGSLGAW